MKAELKKLGFGPVKEFDGSSITCAVPYTCPGCGKKSHQVGLCKGCMPADTMPHAWPIVSDDRDIQAFYEARRREGVSHSLAEMFAFQQAPLPKDDTAWLAANSKAIGGGDLNSHAREYYQEVAKEHGVHTGGSVYMPDVASFAGDPEAWCANQSDYKRKLEKRGAGWSDGTQVVKARNDDIEPEPDVDVAPDIVENRVLDMMAANPELKPTPEVFEQAKDQIKPHWA